MTVTTHAHLHRRALLLAATAFALFVAAVWLYGRHGYAVVLRVYEAQQTQRAADRDGEAKYRELDDYLRVDPTNLRMRGLYVNALIEAGDPPRALNVARAGISAAKSDDQRAIASLLFARAQIAAGSFDDAEATYREVLAAVGESGEAHYGLAQIATARGDTETARRETEGFRQNRGVNNSPGFSARTGPSN